MQIGSMYAWTMLTEFNCQSATCAKIPLHSIIFTQYFIHLPYLHVVLFCPFCYKMYAYVSLPELLEEPHQPVSYQPSKGSFGQKKPVHQLQLSGQVVQRLSGVGFMMMKHQIQFSVLSVFCHCGIPMCLWLASYSTCICTNILL